MKNKDWWLKEIKGVTLVRFRHFEEHSNFKYFITTRNTGFSNDPVSSFNIGFMEDDLPENVIANRKLLAKSLEIPNTSFVFTRQTHSDHIKKVEPEDMQKGLFTKEDAIEDTDGFMLSIKGVCPVIMVADCVPVILFDPKKKVAGVFHAGWRGTVKQIAQKGLLMMISEYGTDPADILASIGPSIGPCCYEVGEEVENDVRRVFPENANSLLLKNEMGKSNFDLWNANKIQLLLKGVLEKNIIVCDLCTYHNPETLFSWRYNEGKTGRMGAGVYLKD